MRRQGPQEGWRAAGVLLSVDGVCAGFTGLVAAAHPEARRMGCGMTADGPRKVTEAPALVPIFGRVTPRTCPEDQPPEIAAFGGLGRVKRYESATARCISGRAARQIRP
jgi:hypothetical protein